ncbi:hypothetical protein P6144_08960 [Sphingomonas sp. HITSZ_GF]|uniref:hypothetical protein n=1 Tax=Sphingomonas sp. HITSZ_GF TaxID=3037247 RepID=UPI00240D9EE8|nr:hypothetical protein [Sphingomonas sp. HITSZ_GF]MDG2533774.1 hypothetical protein [Sphingomonas sp. HITSZ_GF]
MSIMTLKRPEPTYRQTASASDQGTTFSRTRVTAARQQINIEPIGIQQTTDQLLTAALLQATSVVRDGTRDLGVDRAGTLVARIAELLDPAEWEEGDEILKVGSVRTLVRTLIALEHDVGGIALTRAGNLAVSWSGDDGKLRVEALPDGKVSWALICRAGDVIDARHQSSDTIANLRSICES